MSDDGRTLFLDGEEVSFSRGESIFQVAERHQKEIPTLCYDDRLDAFGACRLCIVELEGARNPVASCTTTAESGMRVTTKSGALEMHRRVLLELVTSENRTIDVDELSGYASQEMATLVDRYDARTGRFAGRTSGTSHPSDPNPFILRDYENCISCYRCVRVCAEQEGDYAISIMNRGFASQITTEFDGLLKDSACTFCGQCIQTCPTGALADIKALRAKDIDEPVEKTRSICIYCGVGCAVDIMSKGDKIVGIQPAMDGPANEGALCVKGQFAFDFVHHPDRLATPFVRNDHGQLVPATWDEALDKAAAGLLEAVNEHGRHSLYAIASGRAPNEGGFMMQKLVRAGLGTSYIDNCSRA
ncbi:MAG: (2Fe-2S)-binding protein [Deltaproteobacteria bacterium]|nr:(2Fe-2S)-binding protein [Deltaproteobacteria bacterium]